MSLTVLDNVVKQCTNEEMTARQIQQALLAITNYLRKSQNTCKYHQINIQSAFNNEGIQFFKEEIQRVQQKAQNKFKNLTKKVDNLEEAIMAINDRHVLNHKKMEANVKKKANTFSIQIEELNLQKQRLNQLLNKTIAQLQLQKKQILQRPLQSKQIIGQQKESEHKIRQRKLNKYFGQFSYDGKRLTKVTQNKGCYKHFIFVHQIVFEKQTLIKIKILKSLRRNIYFGVIDYASYKQNENQFLSNNYACYDIKRGSIWPDGVLEGNGVLVGETIEIKVTRKNKSIKWMVNGRQMASTIHEMLGEKERQLFPYVDLFDQDDSIEFIKQ